MDDWGKKELDMKIEHRQNRLLILRMTQINIGRQNSTKNPWKTHKEYGGVRREETKQVDYYEDANKIAE